MSKTTAAINTIIIAVVACLSSHAKADAQSSEPLIYKDNLTYLGAFRVPELSSTTGATFSTGGRALAYDAANNALFIMGHLWSQLDAEISIPTLVSSETINGLNIATMIQGFADPTEGKRRLINPTDPNAQYIGGQLVYKGKLILAAYSYYDGRITQSSSHFIRPLNLSVTGQVLGPFRVGTLYPGYVGGYMALIPPEWQSAFGGPALTGNCCVPGASWESQGPAISVFNPADLGAVNPVPATPLVGYPLQYALGGGWNTQNPEFNGTTHITGVVFPPGTRSVLFFGRHGIGQFCYGIGTSNLSLNLQPVPGTKTKYCYDPASGPIKGTHAYPYVYQVWAYDANTLLQARTGTIPWYEVKPYATWTFDLPFEVSSNSHGIGGAAYDPATQRIYLSQLGADTEYRPIIHVFKLNIPIPQAPDHLKVN